MAYSRALVAALCLGAASASPDASSIIKALKGRIKHVVVLMLENRR